MLLSGRESERVRRYPAKTQRRQEKYKQDLMVTEINDLNHEAHEGREEKNGFNGESILGKYRVGK